MSSEPTDPLGSRFARDSFDVPSRPTAWNPVIKDLRSTSDTPPTPRNGGLGIEILSGDRKGTARSFSGPEVLIGRRPRNHIVLDGPNERIVSGYHVRFELKSDGWWVEDRRSTNGTTLNGTQLEVPTLVRDGDLIELGRRRKVDSDATVRMRATLLASSEARPAASAQDDGEQNTLVAVRPDPPDVEVDPDFEPVGDADPVRPAATDTDLRVRLEPAVNGHETPSKSTPQGCAPAAPSVDNGASALPLKERIRVLQQKSLRLGELNYRLDGLVTRLREQCLAGQAGAAGGVAIDLARAHLGAELLALLERRRSLVSEIASIEVEQPALEARRAVELQPLDDDVLAQSKRVDRAREELETARRKARDAEERWNKESELARASLAMTLDPVVRGLAALEAKSAQRATALDWSKWHEALDVSSHELRRRMPDLETLAASSAEAEAIRQLLAAQTASASKEHAEAVERARSQRAELQSKKAQLESRLAEARIQLERTVERVELDSRQFVVAQFSVEATPLSSLVAFKEACELWHEAESLRSEIARLEESLG